MQTLAHLIRNVKRFNFPYFDMHDIAEVCYKGDPLSIWFTVIGNSLKNACIHEKINFNAWTLMHASADGQEIKYVPEKFENATLTFNEPKAGNVITINVEDNCRCGHSLLNGEFLLGWG